MSFRIATLFQSKNESEFGVCTRSESQPGSYTIVRIQYNIFGIQTVSLELDTKPVVLFEFLVAIIDKLLQCFNFTDIKNLK